MPTNEISPAPWKMWTTSAPHAPIIIYSGDIKPRLKANGYPEYAPGSFIAEVSTFHGEHGNDRGNARLISAAPELLDALISLASIDVKGHSLISRLQFSKSGRAVAAKIEAALDKANVKTNLEAA